MTDLNSSFVARVKLNGLLVNLHHGLDGKFYMTTDDGEIVGGANCPENPHPNYVWIDLENARVPVDVKPEQLYEFIKSGFRERNYTGEVKVTAVFAKMTERITLDFVLRLSDNRITCVDLCLYDADEDELKDAADNEILKDLDHVGENAEMCPPGNLMVVSGDYIFDDAFKKLEEQGYTTLSAFIPASSNDCLNNNVRDSFAWRQLLCLPWQIAKQGNKRSRELHYFEVPDDDKVPAIANFLKNHSMEKILLYFPSCASVMQYAAILKYLGIHYWAVHGKEHLNTNLFTFSLFKKEKTGLLICSESIPLGHLCTVKLNLDWVVRFTKPKPSNLSQYINHLQSAQIVGTSALLVLNDEDADILNDMRSQDVRLTKLVSDETEISKLRRHVEQYLLAEKEAEEGKE